MSPTASNTGIWCGKKAAKCMGTRESIGFPRIFPYSRLTRAMKTLMQMLDFGMK